MRTLREAGWAKAKGGLTTVEEVLRVTQDEQSMGVPVEDPAAANGE